MYLSCICQVKTLCPAVCVTLTFLESVVYSPPPLSTLISFLATSYSPSLFFYLPAVAPGPHGSYSLPSDKRRDEATTKKKENPTTAMSSFVLFITLSPISTLFILVVGQSVSLGEFSWMLVSVLYNGH